MSVAAVIEITSTPEESVPSLRDFVESSGLPSLVVGPSKDPNAKITVLLVSPEGGRAVLAIKAPTTGIAANAVEAERRVLSELQDLLSPETAATLPRVAGRVEFDGRPALVMTAVPGMPMSTSYLRWRHTASPRRVGKDFAALESWLAGFQTASERGTASIDMDGGVTARLRTRFAAVDRLEAHIGHLADIHARLGRSTTPRTAVHGDLWFGNLLVAEGRISGVVDWEAGALSGEPVRDLVRFALMYALYLDRRTRVGRRVAGHPGLRAREWGAGLEYALDGAGWFPDLFRGFLQRGLSRLGAPPERWRDAALAGIAEVAAFTDEDQFARFHFELFQRLAEGTHGAKR